MEKYYDLDNQIAKLERTTSGYFKVTVVERSDEEEPYTVENLFSTEAAALREILSYIETDKDDYAELKGE